MFNEGVESEAPISAEFREPTAMMNSIFKADRAMLWRKAKGKGDKAAMLRSRMLGQFTAGMLKTISTSLLYGTRSDGKSPRGIMQRSDYNALTSEYVHDNAGGAASATANKTSLLILGHGPQKYHWIYPEGIAPPDGTLTQPGKAITGFGIRNDPLPDDLVTDVGGTKEYLAVRNWMTADVGHAIEDARYVQRVCNISTSSIDGVDDFDIDEKVIIRAIHKLPDRENAVIYCNGTLGAQIDVRASEKGNVFHMAKDPFGVYVPHIRDLPIHTWDSIVDTEATVT